MVEPYESSKRRGGAEAVREAERFFMREGAVHRSHHKLAAELNQLGVPCAVAGGMELVAHGYERTTVAVDVLVTQESLARIHERSAGLGYVPPFAGSRDLRDVDTGVRYLALDRLVDLKLASGMTHAGRLKDLADVQELIKALALDSSFAARLDPYVRAKFLESWRGVASSG